jgi:hypothetical protein
VCVCVCARACVHVYVCVRVCQRLGKGLTMENIKYAICINSDWLTGWELLSKGHFSHAG